MTTTTFSHSGVGTSLPRARHLGTRRTGTRVTTAARTAWRRWRARRDALLPVGPEPAGPWAAADRDDRDRARMTAELRVRRG